MGAIYVFHVFPQDTVQLLQVCWLEYRHEALDVKTFQGLRHHDPVQQDLVK